MNKTTTRRWAVALLLSATAATAMSATTYTGLRYVSTTGDYIGQGQTQSFTPPDASVTATGSAGLAQVSVSDPNNWWTITFAAPSGSSLVPGSYPATQRYPFQSPMGNGLDMSGDGRGCNTSRGWFRVKEYKLDAAGNVKHLAIDYLQNCEVTGPPLYGSVRIDSKFPVVVPVTAAIAGPDFAVIAGETATLDGTQSFSRTRTPTLTYQWTQIDGPAVTLANPTSATPSFVAPAIDTASATLHFRLDTTNSAGTTSSDDVVVVVENASTPRTSVNFHGDPGDYITLGQSWSYDTTNAIINFSRNYDGGISANISGNTWWYFDSATPSGTPYQAGVYRNAQRFPFQSATAPGLSLDGDGRGCNTLTGKFTVYQAHFDTAGNPTKADITFEQHCEGGTPAAYGELLLNAVPHATVARQLRAARVRFPRQ